MNLYNFHKIKNPEGHIEFGHEQFRREAIENLQYITRKVNTDNETKNQKTKGQKTMSFEYNRLLGIVRNLENNLKVANQNNEKMSNTNKNLQLKVDQMVYESEKRTRKMFYVFWFATSNFQAELLLKIKKVLLQFEVKVDDSLFISADISCLSNILEEKKIFSCENSDELIDKLLILVTNYHNLRPNNKYNKVNIQSLLERFNFSQEKVKISRTPPKLEKLSSCARSDRYSLESSPLQRFPSILNMSTEEADVVESRSTAIEWNFKDLSRVSKVKSGNTAEDTDMVNIDDISFNYLRSPKSERIYNY